MAQSDEPRPLVEEQLDRIHWHISRSDQLRAGLAARTGAVLSTNALIVAGIALAFSAKSQRPDVATLTVAMVALGCVAFSVTGASMALVTIRRWQGGPSTLLYNYGDIGDSVDAIDDLRRKLEVVTPEERLNYALIEFWRCARLHRYRNRKLRTAMRWLLAGLFMFLVAVAASVLG